MLDFGVVSHGFTNSRTITLNNTSEIAIAYRLRTPSESPDKEFEFSPVEATIHAFNNQKIIVDFTSYSVKKYDALLVVDIDDVGRDMLTLPIRADSRAPDVCN